MMIYALYMLLLTQMAHGASSEQLRIQLHVGMEAIEQGVDPALALAMADVETGFKHCKARRSGARSALQVHKSALRKGELPKLLLDPAWAVKRGVELIKIYHAKAKGDPALTRILYVCGYGYKKSCSVETLKRIRFRWAPVAKKWRVNALSEV